MPSFYVVYPEEKQQLRIQRELSYIRKLCTAISNLPTHDGHLRICKRQPGDSHQMPYPVELSCEISQFALRVLFSCTMIREQISCKERKSFRIVQQGSGTH